MSPRRALLAGWLVVAGCLPQSGPGVGEQRIEERYLAHLSGPPTGAGEDPTVVFARRSSVVVARPNDPGMFRSTWDLYAMRPGQPELLLQQDYQGGGLRFDARGKVYVTRDETAVVDLATGARTTLAFGGQSGMSPGGQLFYVINGKPLVRTADGVVHELPAQIAEPTFVDEVMYARDIQGRLWRVRPDGSPPQVLAMDIDDFRVVPRPGLEAALVIINRSGTCLQQQARLVRPEAPTMVDPLPLADGDSEAPGITVQDGKVILREPPRTITEAAFAIVTLEPRATRRLVVPTMTTQSEGSRRRGPAECQQVSNPLQVVFRPGTQEVWALGRRALTIIQPDDQRVTFTGPFQAFHVIDRSEDFQNLQFSSVPRARAAGSPFTADGQLWASRDDRSSLQLRRVSDPGGPGLINLPAATSVIGLRDVQGTNTIAVWGNAAGGNADLHLFDADLMTRRKTILDIRHIIFGQRRLLMLSEGSVNDMFAPANLDLVDLTTDQVQRLATNVTEMLPLASCLGCDRAAPGATLVYAVSARVPWKYDGLWVATLP